MRSAPPHIKQGIKATLLLENEIMQISNLQAGEQGRVIGFKPGEKIYRHKLLAMGLTPNTTFKITRVAPLGDPIELKIRGFALSLRKVEANCLQIEKVE